MKISVLLWFFALGVAAAGVLVYLTPLRYVTVVQPSVKFIDPVEFYEAFQKSPDEYFFVDIRPAFLRFDYPEGVVNHSIFLLSTEYKTFPKDKKIIIFCEEDISESVAYGFLEHYGFTRIRAIKGGRTAWKEAGLPLVRNEQYKTEAEPFLSFFREGGLLPGGVDAVTVTPSSS